MAKIKRSQDGKQPIRTFNQGALTFFLTSDKVFVRSSGGQLFFLEAREHYWRRKLRTIRIMIELGEIRSFDELASWTGEEIEWISSSNKYHPELPLYEKA